ncbi:MAG: enolase C-terminal domain-like protein [Deltaproteobacteria bacterium]
MKIESATLLPYAIPLVAPLPTAAGRILERRGFVVSLVAEGQPGIGEAAPHPAAEPSVWRETEEALRTQLAGLVGADTREVATDLLPTLPPAAAMGLDLALRDAEARGQGCCLAEALGAQSRAPVRVSALLGGDDLAEAARRARAAGFRAVKLKAARDVETTLARVRSVRTAAPELSLRVDANGAWDRATALEAARALVCWDLEWLEQPCAIEDLAGMRAVREAGVRVAADEAIAGADDVRRLVAAAAVDVVVIKFCQVGGIGAALAVARATAEAGLGLSLTTGIDSAIATTAMLHLAAALRPGPDAGCATLSRLAGDLVYAAPREGSEMALPTGPGLGLTLDMASPFLQVAHI